MGEAEVTEPISPEMERAVKQRASDRSAAGRWDLDVAVFLFAILIIVIILLFQDMGIEIVAPVAIFGLAMVWLVGWRRGRELYRRYYQEEMGAIRQVLKKTVKGKVGKKVEVETVEEKVQRALRERWR